MRINVSRRDWVNLAIEMNLRCGIRIALGILGQLCRIEQPFTESSNSRFIGESPLLGLWEAIRVVSAFAVCLAFHCAGN
jgi:hypothetical protein